MCLDFPGHVVDWLGKYDITVEEALSYGWQYGRSRDQLVFLFKDGEGRVEAYQARNFSKTATRKYFTQGPVAKILPIYPQVVAGGLHPRLVLVEDVLSAVKTARKVPAMPLLGSTLPKAKMAALRLLGVEELIFWLDYDKWAEACKQADQAKLLGFKTKVIQTLLDPKEYGDEYVAERLAL